MEISIRTLDPSLVHQANMNSMGGKRGDLSVTSYESYCERVLSWPISDEKKQKIVDQIYQKLSEQLRHEARHVSVMVAGPSGYNPKKLDHSDMILRLSAEFVEWFKDMESQIQRPESEDSKRASAEDHRVCGQPAGAGPHRFLGRACDGGQRQVHRAV